MLNYFTHTANICLYEVNAMSTEERVRILREARPNSWIALSADESKLLASNESYSEAVKLAKAQGEPEPILIRIPDTWIDRVYSLCL